MFEVDPQSVDNRKRDIKSTEKNFSSESLKKQIENDRQVELAKALRWTVAVGSMKA